MRRPRGGVLDGAAGGAQRLADHLAAEHPLPARLRRAAAEQVHLQRLEIENVEDFLNGGGHAGSEDGRQTTEDRGQIINSLSVLRRPSSVVKPAPGVIE